jgi:hypothetical protein
VKPTVPIANPFSVVVTGESANTSRLIVYLNKTQKCAKTAALDAAHPGDAVIINTMVTGAYSKTQPEVAHFLGRHYACAYLRSLPPPTPVLLRARAGAPYTVINAAG